MENNTDNSVVQNTHERIFKYLTQNLDLLGFIFDLVISQY